MTPPIIPIADYIQQHGPDELGHVPTPADIRLAQAKAMSIFTRIVEDSLLGRFLHIDTPASLWTALHDACASNTVNQKMLLHQQIFQLHLPEGGSMATNFLAMNRLVHELASVSVSFPDEDLNCFYLNALPPSWDTFHTVVA